MSVFAPWGQSSKSVQFQNPWKICLTTTSAQIYSVSKPIRDLFGNKCSKSSQFQNMSKNMFSVKTYGANVLIDKPIISILRWPYKKWVQIGAYFKSTLTFLEFLFTEALDIFVTLKNSFLVLFFFLKKKIVFHLLNYRAI